MTQSYENELVPILHRILDVSAKTIHLNQVPNWPRDSLPKSLIIQKLGLIAIPVLYPWWSRELEIEYEQFGPFSPVLNFAFEQLLENGKCAVIENELEIQPMTIEEINDFPEISELFIQKIISYSNNPILSEFECLEIFSIISVEQEQLFRKLKILRRMTSLTNEHKKLLTKRVIKKMNEIPHLNSFIVERGLHYAMQFISETIDAFYHAIALTIKSNKNDDIVFM